MNIIGIKEQVKKIISSDECKSLLIDGAWGCGKTTVIKEAIEELTNDTIAKKKIVYQSLFGIKDISELTACFSYVGKIIYSVGKSIASPFAKLIPIVGENIKESIDNSTSLFTPNPSKKKDTVFIFDDLERADKSLSYITLLGFFNQLIMRGCKIVCISSLNDLSKADVERKEGLDAFLEKAFDRILFINEFPDEVIEKIFEDNDKMKQCIKQCADMFDSNIRVAIKTHRLLLDICNKSNELKYNLSKEFTDLQVMKSAICAIKSIYCLNKKEQDETKEKKATNPFESTLIIDESSKLDSRIVKNIHEVIKNDSIHYLPEEKEDIKRLTKSMCMVEVHDDYSLLSKNYPIESQRKNNNAYGDSVFYYDDEGKLEYFSRFKKDTLDGKLNIDKAYIDRLVEFIKYTDFNLNEDGLLDCVVKNVIENYSKGDYSAYSRLHDYFTFPEETSNNKIIVNIYNDISSKLHKAENDSIENGMNNAYKSNVYNYLVDILYDIERYKKPEHVRKCVKQLLLSNDFYMPDLSKTLEYESWLYCHQVARLSKMDDELSIAFVNYLKQEVQKHVNSKSAIDRAKSLIQYNFNVDTFNEFMNFCDSLSMSE